MLQKLLVIVPGVVNAIMRPAALLAVFRRMHGGDRLAQQIVEFQGFDQVGVPNQGSVRHLHVVERREHVGQFSFAVGERLSGAEHRGIALHDSLHVKADVGGAARALGIAEFVEPRQRGVGRIGLERAVRSPRLDEASAMLGGLPPEDDQIEQIFSTVRKVLETVK